MQAKLISIVILVTFLTSNAFSQNKGVTISGLIKDKANKSALSYVNVVLKTEKDSAFVTGTVSNEEGRFTLSNVNQTTITLKFLLLVMLLKGNLFMLEASRNFWMLPL